MAHLLWLIHNLKEMKFSSVAIQPCSSRIIIKCLVIYIVGCALCYFFLLNLNFLYAIPNNDNLLNWDANWYNSIRDGGYVFLEGRQCNLAFFPLFPYFWKATAMTPFMISALNGIIFLSSLFFLLNNERVDPKFIFLVLSLPSYIFFYLPYSESLFFLFGMFIIEGYRKDSGVLKMTGFFFASMARSVSIIFIPAIIIFELLFRTHHDNTTQKWKSILINCLASFSGLGVAVLIQGLQTGKWFYFTEVMVFWNRIWHFPSFPLSTPNAEKIIGVDGLAFTIGLFAIFLVLWRVYRVFVNTKRMKSKNQDIGDHVVFSALFVSAITVLDTFHSDTINGATSLWSINRHLLCTPFAITLLTWGYSSYRPKLRELKFGVLTIVACWYLTGVYKYPLASLFFMSFFITFSLIKYSKIHSYYFIFAFLFQLVLQLVLLEEFLWYKWVG